MLKKKILYYNWVPFDNELGLGGGVSVYIKNIIGEVLKHDKYSIYYLSSGYLYNPLKHESYIEKCSNIYGKKCKTFQLINSAVIGPLGNLAWNIKKYINDEDTYKIIAEFMKKEGPFDIVHMFNIGGFGQSILTLKKEFPKTKFIFDLHNYNSICMNSYLFNHKKSQLCDNFCEGKSCIECYSNLKIQQNLYKDRVKKYWSTHIWEKIKYKIKNCFKNNYKNNYKEYYVCDYKKNLSTAQDFRIYRENNIDYLNNYFDKIIAVSQRVKEIAEKYGIDKNKLIVSYIGTKFADIQQQPRDVNVNKNLKIAYLGYANVLKGFYFLLEALSKLPKETAEKIEIVLAAKNIKEEIVLTKLNEFASVKIFDGYNHDNLDSILKDVDLGIIPVLWEDNLPQVAIEMVSKGIPILCRDLGGASELSKSKQFIFKTEEEFINKLIHFTKDKASLHEYWNKHIPLTSMEQNYMKLDEIYQNLLMEN